MHQYLTHARNARTDVRQWRAGAYSQPAQSHIKVRHLLACHTVTSSWPCVLSDSLLSSGGLLEVCADAAGCYGRDSDLVGFKVTPPAQQSLLIPLQADSSLTASADEPYSLLLSSHVFQTPDIQVQLGDEAELTFLDRELFTVPRNCPVFGPRPELTYDSITIMLL
ncbi:hypothetical protein C8Q72DRAFT_797636 [Fomitopsis betulina]|nr:hypothetical protein C8Q72DRAFT_797636 [Fomitopsis betulina]